MKHQYNRAYDILLLLGLIAIICCITRLWPLLLLILVGVIVAALMLLCRAGEPQKEQPVRQDTARPVPDRPEPTEQELVRMAYGLIQKRITAQLVLEFPQVRWIWESSTSMQDIQTDGIYPILLNHAGGYNRAWVQIQGLRLMAVTLNKPEMPVDILQQNSAEVEETDPMPPDMQREPADDADGASTVNYALLAFGWVEDHMSMLIEMCNEGIAKNDDSFLIPVSALPDREAWDEICCQLEQHDFPAAQIVEDGIQATIPN